MQRSRGVLLTRAWSSGECDVSPVCDHRVMHLFLACQASLTAKLLAAGCRRVVQACYMLHVSAVLTRAVC
jgi:hypothetical protein